MKKIFTFLSVILVISLTSCGSPSVYNPGSRGTEANNDEFYFQVDTTIYKVKYVSFGSGTGGIYVTVPKDANVTIPQTITYHNGKSTTAVVKIDK